MVRHARASFAARYRDETASDLGEQLWWKRAVVAGLTIDGPQVRPRPDEAVAFGQDDPGARLVEAETSLGHGGNFDRIGGIGRWRLGNRQDAKDRRGVR